jgi:hypothetical protein
VSLTGRLDSRAGRAFLRDRVCVPKVERAPQRIERRTAQPSRMGAALDYAIRFRMWKEGHADLRPLVAWSGLDADGAHPHRCPLAIRSLRRVYRRSVEALETNTLVELSDAAAEACMRLAELDIIHRAGLKKFRFHPTGPDEWAELQALWSIVPWDEFIGFRWTVLNPTFGAGSRLVGGADADLLVDDVLVDFKCSVRPGLAIRDVRQVVGYAVLANRFGVDGLDPAAFADWPGDQPVTHLGLYLARAGVLHVFPLNEAISPFHQRELLEFLVGRRVALAIAGDSSS